MDKVKFILEISIVMLTAIIGIIKLIIKLK